MGITPQQFERMKSRASGTRCAQATALAPGMSASAASRQVIILGIDPSLRGTGYGIIRSTQPWPQLLAQGTIRSREGWQRSRCLVQIAQALGELLQQYQPAVCVVEGLFYAQNLRTALILGEARGACLVAVGEAGLGSFEIAPPQGQQSL